MRSTTTTTYPPITVATTATTASHRLFLFDPNPPSLLPECLRQRTFLPPWAWPPSSLCRSPRSAAAWAFGPSTWRLGVSNYLPIMPRKTFSQHIHTHVHVHVLVSFENI